jgi:hypothetical protein
MVYLQTPEGVLVSRKLQYTLAPEPSPVYDEPAGNTWDIPQTPVAKIEEPEGNLDGKNSDELEKTLDGEKSGESGETPDEPEKNSDIENPEESGKNHDGEDLGEDVPIVEPVKDTPKTIPKLELFPKTDNPFSRRWAADDDQDYIIHVDHLDRNLPVFRFPEELNIGAYTLVFQILGEREILYRTAKSVFYLGDAEFSIEDIQIYLPSAVDGARIAPPKLNIILEVLVHADERLNPYVVWYNGKKKIGEGNIAGGVQRLIWQTPAENGFNTLRAEVFPFPPGNGAGSSIAGKIKELSLPVSSRYEEVGVFEKESGGLTRWYQFWGNLQDTLAASAEQKRDLAPLNNGAPQWLPYGNIYGLSIGSGGVYTVPGSSWLLADQSPIQGQILFYFVPLAAGTILNASFQLDPLAPETLDLNLSVEADGLVLAFTNGVEIREDRAAFDAQGSGGFISAVINYRIEPDRFSAELRLKDTKVVLPSQSLPLSHAITNVLTVQLGGVKTIASLPVSQAGDQGDSGGTGLGSRDNKSTGPVAILSELAFASFQGVKFEEESAITTDPSPDLSVPTADPKKPESSSAGAEEKSITG